MAKSSIARGQGPVKMREIARRAGVSIATISRVLSGNQFVDPVTAERVRTIVRETNYVPNSTGPALKSGRSGVVGLIVPGFNNPFFADFVLHLERQLVERDQEMLLAITDHTPEQMQRCVRRMLMRGTEGIIVLESEIETQSFEAVLHNRVPLVTLNRLTLEPGVCDVAIDALSGMSVAIRHLQQLGHRRIGFLAGTSGQRIALARETSFREALQANHLRLNRNNIVEANFSLQGGQRAMHQLLQQPSPPTAILCANDLSAIGALRTLAEKGLRPGRDISIIGLDDIDLCTMISPTLSTLRLPRQGLVSLFVDALDCMLSDPHGPGKQFFQQLELVVRETTGPAPPSAAASSRRKGAPARP